MYDFHDTMFAGTPSRSGNKCAQVYSTTRKGEAHETLSLLFHRDGVPPTMVLDGSKEQCLGDFKRKLREADCHLRQTEPYSPWQQATEGCSFPENDQDRISADIMGPLHRARDPYPLIDFQRHLHDQRRGAGDHYDWQYCQHKPHL